MANRMAEKPKYVPISRMTPSAGALCSAEVRISALLPPAIFSHWRVGRSTSSAKRSIAAQTDAGSPGLATLRTYGSSAAALDSTAAGALGGRCGPLLTASHGMPHATRIRALTSSVKPFVHIICRVAIASPTCPSFAKRAANTFVGAEPALPLIAIRQSSSFCLPSCFSRSHQDKTAPKPVELARLCIPSTVRRSYAREGYLIWAKAHNVMSISCVRNSLILRREAAASAVNRGLEDNRSVANDQERLPKSCEFNSGSRVRAAEDIASMSGA
mmetsp:Transcript_27896/g.51006  ORF Transcript_27896/g.51006 Transcript_27896/m.51006 type:complete len:272 (+) Transcript_27896:698-1513(+)